MEGWEGREGTAIKQKKCETFVIYKRNEKHKFWWSFKSLAIASTSSASSRPAVSVIFMGNNLLKTLSIARGRKAEGNFVLSQWDFLTGLMVSEGFSFFFLLPTSTSPFSSVIHTIWNMCASSCQMLRWRRRRWRRGGKAKKHVALRFHRDLFQFKRQVI